MVDVHRPATAHAGIYETYILNLNVISRHAAVTREQGNQLLGVKPAAAVATVGAKYIQHRLLGKVKAISKMKRQCC